MEFLLIGDSKLKILMDAVEMKSYKLDSVYADSCDSGFRRSFFRILERAKEKVGFDVGGDKVLIQFYKTGKGGCEIFVTKLGLLSPSAAKLISKSERITLLDKGMSFYSFASESDLIAAAKALKNNPSGLVPRGDMYVSDEGEVFLGLEEIASGGYSAEFPIILEFGHRLPDEAEIYVREHCKRKIAESAIEILSAGE